MKLIYKNEDRFLVNNAELALNNANIETLLKNEFAAGAAGEISPIDAWPEVWIVDDSQLAQAEKIIEQLDHTLVGDNWFCSQCQEQNAASFDFCWQCQHEKP